MQAHTRIYTLDNLRAIAIITMVIYHVLFDLNLFGLINLNLDKPPITFLVIIFGVLFVTLAGITSALSHKLFKQSLKLLVFALLISITTYFFDKHTYVRFGILHLLALLTFILYLTKHKYLLLISLVFPILINYFYPNMMSIILGFPPTNFTSLDYYPIFPWAIPFGLGYILSKPIIQLAKSSSINFHIPIISSIGKHSLIIYLIHQPIIFTIVFLCSKIAP